ncbi:Dehydrodolichyl diphosphate synthase 2 [Bienertia sinuspersici]
MIKQVEEATKTEAKPKLELRLAVCYAGKRDILQATRRLCEKAKAGKIEPNAIDMTTFDGELEAGNAPTPELLIRTGGELRLSNYMIWHLAQAEYYFLPNLAPEFTEHHFLDALRSFQQRDRNFGK